MDEKMILIVDDEMDVLTLLKKRLTSRGYSVITADTGNSALELAMEHLPDLIVLDVGLADMHGGEVAMKLREHPDTWEIPVIFISALYSKTDEIGKSNIFGGRMLFSKPYDTERLLAGISKILNPRSAVCR